MREFKFRVWNVEDNKWDNPAILEVFDRSGEFRPLYNPIENYIIQQYTGVKDKNGKEIYEGDLIEYKGEVGTIEFFAGMFICSWRDQADNELGYMLTVEIKIVGNIFENKDLIGA